MNKLLIPTTLAAIVLIAGVFALAPIEKASTVHTQLQATTAQTDTAVITASNVPAVAGSTLIDISVNQDFTVEIGQFFATVTTATVTIEDIVIENANGDPVETINFADIGVVAGSQIVFPEDVHSNISLPTNWSVVIRGQSGGTGNITLMVGVITEGDAIVTVN